MEPFIGAAMVSNGVRFYTAQEFFRIAELDFRTVPRFPLFLVSDDKVIQRFYIPPLLRVSNPETEKSSEEIVRLCEAHPRMLIFDLQSFEDETESDVRIGKDPEFAPEGLVGRVEKRLTEENLVWMQNDPEIGTYIPAPARKGNTFCDLVSIRLMFNRIKFRAKTVRKGFSG